jgi:sugar-specific transcriptional regulator TrmB
VEPEKRILNEIIEILGSEGKIKVLWTLYKSHTPQTTYSIIKVTGLKRVDVKRILETLKKKGIVKESEYRPKKYMLNIENEKTEVLVTFFEKIESCF